MTDTGATRAVASLGERALVLLPSETRIRRLDIEDSARSLGGGLHASVAEIYLQASRNSMRERDFLCVVAMIVEREGGVPVLDSLHALSPQTLRSRATAIPTGVVIGDLPVGPVSDRISQIGILLYGVPRVWRFGRVIEAIQSLTTAARYAGSADGARAVLVGVLDRLGLLAQMQGVSTVLGGIHRLEGSAGAHYALLGTGRTGSAFSDSFGGDDTQYQVKEGRLYVGRSRDAASPWRSDEFLLLSIGPARAGIDPNRIDQLRRQHTLLPSGAVLHASTAAPETYQVKVERLRLANRLASIYGPRGAQRLPVVTPVSVSIASDLADVVLVGGELASTLGLMRDGLKYEVGCEFPTVRVTSSADQGTRSYTISIDEVQLVSGTLRPDRLLCSATVDRLKALSIEAEEAINPANGNACALVALDQVEALNAAKITTWPPVGYLVLHLSAVLRKNAACFVGIESLANVLRRTARYDEIQAAPGGLPRFLDVVRGMLEDEVPIHEMRAICDRYLQVTDLPTYEVLEEIRALRSITGDLFWNKADTPIYRLGPRFLDLIDRGITREGEATVLALEPEPTQSALTVVRNEVTALPPTARNPVIFCEDWRMRPFVRKLVELEFPHLRVVSRRESTNPDARPVVGTIELDR